MDQETGSNQVPPVSDTSGPEYLTSGHSPGTERTTPSEDNQHIVGPDQPYQFSFIDVSSKDARKQARRHVMREFMRQKRGDEDIVPPINPVRQGSQRSDSRNSRRQESTEAAATTSTTGEPTSLTRRKRSVEALKPDREDADEAYHRQLVARRSSSSLRSSRSQSPMGPLTGRRDPFETLPMLLDKEDFGLVDHYITVVPELMCNFKGMRLRSGVTANNFNPTRDIILPQAMNNPITFQATALAFAAGHLARLHGKTDTAQSQKHRMQTLRKLREHFFGQKAHSDDLDIMVAVLSLASCEDRFGENARAWIHMRGCIAMLQKLLGKLDWKKDRRLYTYMNWVLITMTGYDPCAVKTLAGKKGSPRLSFLAVAIEPANANVSPDVTATKQAINEFISFLQASHHLNRRPGGLQKAALPSSRRNTMFQPGKPLNKLLTSVPGARPGVRSTNIQKACRFACALYLNAVLLELATVPEKLEEYLKRLSIRLIEQELDYNESTETLMWILLFGDETGDETYHQSVLVWWVGRMTNVAKRLNNQHWGEVSLQIVQCLTQEEDKVGHFDDKSREWRQELLQAPLSWWPEAVVPSLENGLIGVSST